MSNKTIKYLSLAVCCVLVSCMPRGETKTIDEVYTRAHEEFVIASRSAKGDDTKKTLAELEASLQKLVAFKSNETDLNGIVTPVVDNLSKLAVAAGYTSRPAMAELIQQLEYSSQINTAGLSEEQSELVNEKSRKLLAARVYDLLSSEINGVGFQLKDRELKL